ncbi:CP2 transcription factor [Sclerotinia borealis F-4128]|uniref:CP2 transcription factor n=1 Tax=Sclerotinia borealis (strain F-4128) TaxID=1432307 RepID=W9CLE0_SCLBF|nr:CP2 transcription factor [Sclerotinia borealis F-4128]
MFANRNSSQKPGEDFIASFRKSYPAIGSSTSAAEDVDDVTHLTAPAGSEEMKDSDPTPRAQNDPWKLDTSDPNSYSSASFPYQIPGYYTPTAGGPNAQYQSQAGDLHTPLMGMGMNGMGLGTSPLCTSTAGDHTHHNLSMFSPIYGHPHMAHQFPPYNQFMNPLQHHQQQVQQLQATSFAPSTFVHQDTGYETMDHEGSPVDDEGPLGSIELNMHQAPLLDSQLRSYRPATYAPVPSSAENFRFHATLSAPTAMIKDASEIPVTYLNKGQAYSLSITDTALDRPRLPGTRYRTFIRISFEDEEQSQKPTSCWQLWKEGRGTNEAHQRGGKLQAVEYVEAGQPAESDGKRARVELDTASFDGFSVIWTPSITGSPECNIAVRFNFLSTDFSHSKGVKGIPLRFCAKTEILESDPQQHVNESAEVAYCVVKLFRDHGAERKLSNDIAHVKKTIEKLEQQISQAETGMKDFGKRKKGAVAKPQKPLLLDQGPGKTKKHKRTWSVSSASSAGGQAPEEDLHFKLRTQRDMFDSPRIVSVLYLRGSEQDDPDLHPVALAGEPLDLTKVDPGDNAIWAARSARSSTTDTSSIVSPSHSSNSLHSSYQSQAAASASASASNPSASWGDFHNPPLGDFQKQNTQRLASPPDQLTRVPKSDETGNLNVWIEALDVDPSYNPPILERTIKPVACFYVLHRDPTRPGKDEFHRAIYLMQRTLKDFTDAIALKWNIEPTKIWRTTRVLESGLRVKMDDDVVRELSDGQDFILEVQNFQPRNMLERAGYELCLFF